MNTERGAPLSVRCFLRLLATGASRLRRACGCGANCARRSAPWQRGALPHFWRGGALGFDTMAAQEVLRVPGERFPHLRLGSSPPCRAGVPVEPAGRRRLPGAAAPGGRGGIHSESLYSGLPVPAQPLFGGPQRALCLLPAAGYRRMAYIGQDAWERIVIHDPTQGWKKGVPVKGPAEEAQGLVPRRALLCPFSLGTVLFQSVCSFEKAAVQRECFRKTPLQASK